MTECSKCGKPAKYHFCSECTEELMIMLYYADKLIHEERQVKPKRVGFGNIWLNIIKISEQGITVKGRESIKTYPCTRQVFRRLEWESFPKEYLCTLENNRIVKVDLNEEN